METIDVICWCGRKPVPVPRDLWESGKTLSCHHRSGKCADPKDQDAHPQMLFPHCMLTCDRSRCKDACVAPDCNVEGCWGLK